jgi:hypothetical protein
MKKGFAILSALVFFCGFAAAQATITGWGRGLFVPVIEAAGMDPLMIIGQSWGLTSPTRQGFTLNFKTDNLGIRFDINADWSLATNDSGGAAIPTVRLGDQQKIWIKPFDMLTVTIGTQLYDDRFRGNAVFGVWDWLRLKTMNGEDSVFRRIVGSFEIALEPVEGLYAFAAVDKSVFTAFRAPTDALVIGQYGIGYAIADFGVIRAQYDGASAVGSITPYGIVNAAFKLTAVPDLVIDLGVFAPTDFAESPVWIEAQADRYYANIALYAKYKIDQLNIWAEGNFKLWKKHAYVSNDAGNPGFEAGIGSEYTIDKASNLIAGIDLRYTNNVQAILAGLSDQAISGAAFIYKNFSNGLIGIAFQATNGQFITSITKKATADFVYAVPIRIDYWF